MTIMTVLAMAVNHLSPPLQQLLLILGCSSPPTIKSCDHPYYLQPTVSFSIGRQPGQYWVGYVCVCCFVATWCVCLHFICTKHNNSIVSKYHNPNRTNERKMMRVPLVSFPFPLAHCILPRRPSRRHASCVLHSGFHQKQYGLVSHF